MRRLIPAAQLVAEARGRTAELVPINVTPGRSTTLLDRRTRAVTRLYDPAARDAAEREADAVERAFAGGLPVPELIERFEFDGQIGLIMAPTIGAPLSLVEAGLGPAEHHALMRQLGLMLARLHGIEPGPPSDAVSVCTDMADRARSMLRNERTLANGVRSALLSRIEALHTVAPTLRPYRPVLIHGAPDDRHVFVRRQRTRTIVSALVGFAASGAGDAMADLAVVLFDGARHHRSRIGVIEGYQKSHPIDGQARTRLEIHLIARLATALQRESHPAERTRLADVAMALIGEGTLARVVRPNPPRSEGLHRFRPREFGGHQ